MNYLVCCLEELYACLVLIYGKRSTYSSIMAFGEKVYECLWFIFFLPPPPPLYSSFLLFGFIYLGACCINLRCP